VLRRHRSTGHRTDAAADQSPDNDTDRSAHQTYYRAGASAGCGTTGCTVRLGLAAPCQAASQQHYKRGVSRHRSIPLTICCHLEDHSMRCKSGTML
jgi:hypothetical protein